MQIKNNLIDFEDNLLSKGNIQFHLISIIKLYLSTAQRDPILLIF